MSRRAPMAGRSRPSAAQSLIPSPFDQRLILRIAPAVARAAMESGVATRPIADFDAYIDRLTRFVFRSGVVMKPMIEAAKAAPQRVVYADGEDERVLRAAQIVIEEKLAEPILIGRPSVIEARLKRYGLALRLGTDCAVINPEDDPRYRTYVDLYFSKVGRRGINPEAARTIVRTNTTVIGALARRNRRRRRADLRSRGPFRQTPRRHRQRHRAHARRRRLFRPQPAHQHTRQLLPHRHACDGRTRRGARSPR